MQQHPPNNTPDAEDGGSEVSGGPNEEASSRYSSNSHDSHADEGAPLETSASSSALPIQEINIPMTLLENSQTEEANNAAVSPSAAQEELQGGEEGVVMHKDPLGIGVPLPVRINVNPQKKKPPQQAGFPEQGAARLPMTPGPAVASVPPAAAMDVASAMDKGDARHGGSARATAQRSNPTNRIDISCLAEKQAARITPQRTVAQEEGAFQNGSEETTDHNSNNRAPLQRQQSLPGAFSVEGIGSAGDSFSSHASGNTSHHHDDNDEDDEDDRRVEEILVEATLVVEEDAIPNSSANQNHFDSSRSLESNSHSQQQQQYPGQAPNMNERNAGLISAESCSLHSFLSDLVGPEQAGFNTTGAASHDNLLVEAKPLQWWHLSRKGTVIMVVGILVIVAIVIGITIPLTNKNSSSAKENTLLPNSDSVPFLDKDEILTNVPEAICWSLLPLMSNVSHACPDRTKLPHGGPLNQLVVDAIFEQVYFSSGQPVDVVIMNGGALRGEIVTPGPLTVEMVRSTILPFVSNMLVILSITPLELKATLEGSLANKGNFVPTPEQQRDFFPYVPPVNLTWAIESPYPYAAGLRYNVNLTAPEGEKFTDIEIRKPNDVWVMLDSTDEETLLRVVASDFLAGGGDGYFPGIPEERKEPQKDTFLTDQFMLYCSRQYEILGPVEHVMSTKRIVPFEGY